MRAKRFLLVLASVVGAILMLSNSAFASNGWTRLGGDPVTPGGLAAFDHGNARHGYVKLITSRKGATAMKYAGLSKSARKKFVLATREGNFRQCVLRYGDHFIRMSFGINGTSVDRNVTFRDPRYKRHGAPAFCSRVVINVKTTVKHGLTKLVKTVTNSDGSKTEFFDRVDTITTKTCFIETKVPFKCGNFAVVRHKCITKVTHVHHQTTKTIPPPSPPPPPQTPPPSKPPITIGKVCEDDTGVQETCPTGGTFTFQVTTGGTTTTVPLDSNPQSAGTCKVGDSVIITENPKNGWEILSDNPETFTCESSGVQAEFKNRQTPPPPPPSCHFDTIQEVDTSDFSTGNISTAPVKLHCLAPAGNTLQITMHVNYGTLSVTNSFTVIATGSDQVIEVTYTAPTEPVTDTVSAHVVDLTTGEVQSPDPSTPIDVVQPPPNPSIPSGVSKELHST